MLKRRGLSFAIALSAVMLTGLAPGAAVAADIDDPWAPGPIYRTVTDDAGQLQLQSMGRPDGQDMVFRISGSVYANVEGNALDPKIRHGQKLFNLEGYNIRRLYRVPGTTQIHQLSREIVFYTSPTNPTQILTEWTNPVDGKIYPVVPINNDRVAFGPFNVTPSYVGPPLQQRHEETAWTSDIPVNTNFGTTLGERFGLKNGYYSAMEMFDFYVDDRERAARTVDGTVPTGAMKTKISWSRTSPWAPFMCLPEESVQGQLTYHARSWALNSYAEVEPWLRAKIDLQYPLYQAAPTDPGASENSWSSFYNKQLGRGATTWAQWCTTNGR
ncbi:DUF1838 family protein [Nonomuraea endophytica]|uniref:DUF1838 domain-containing protein n=1 Tax=Nonomuraea endophytica TaxID=714136 RepID=A0A7W8EGD1_9ACTN|nr:DUF1838 family protein [Nonomuraea endophytica]MBB5079705.1 hypothetical protein [Nonomuraea endophytica]